MERHVPSSGSGVEAVVTYNYDNLLEIALSSSVDWQIVRRADDSAGNRLPIYHVHGYVPLDDGGSSEADEIIFEEHEVHTMARQLFEAAQRSGSPVPADYGTDHNAPALLTQSRERAVDRVFRGSLFTVVGSGGFLAGAYQLGGLGLGSALLAMGGLLGAGAGLVMLGRAASHLRRFGADGAHGLLSAGGALGLSVLGWGVPQLLRMLGGPVWLDWVALAGSLGTVASLGIVTILVVRLILAVTAPSDREEGAA